MASLWAKAHSYFPESTILELHAIWMASYLENKAVAGVHIYAIFIFIFVSFPRECLILPFL